MIAKLLSDQTMRLKNDYKCPSCIINTCVNAVECIDLDLESIWYKCLPGYIREFH